jgi:hypothetical protein
MLDMTIGEILAFVAFWAAVVLGWAAIRGYWDGIG